MTKNNTVETIVPFELGQYFESQAFCIHFANGL